VIANLAVRQGMDLTRQDLKNASHKTGGHGSVRNVINKLTTDAYNDLISLSIAKMLEGQFVVIHSLGSKYKRESNILCRALARYDNWVFVP
jgi:hypothetical protein